MFLEKIINKTIEYYWENNKAFIEKKQVPITFATINENKVVGAKLKSKSTVDYIGCYNGIFLAFEAKSTNEKTMPKNNIKDHQIDYLVKITQNGGIGFFIFFFNFCNQFFLVKIEELMLIWNDKLSYENIKKIGIEIELTFPGILDFIPKI